jgi:hypothetical protein
MDSHGASHLAGQRFKQGCASISLIFGRWIKVRQRLRQLFDPQSSRIACQLSQHSLTDKALIFQWCAQVNQALA